MKYLLRKLGSFVATLCVISILVFLALQVLPGDPAILILGTEGDPAALEVIRDRLGLSDPPLIRYGQWMFGVLQGDFGESIRYNVPVSSLLIRALPVTLGLALLGVGVAIVIAIPLGISCAIHKGQLVDNLGLILSQLGMAIPAFWMGILLMQLLAVRYGLFPPGGYVGAFSLVLPGLALALPRAAVLTRMVRSSMLQTIEQDYVRTARSKGLTEFIVLYKHALRNASINIFTVAGIHLTQLLAGTIIIEQVFSLPGLGQLLLAGVLQRDLPLVQGLVMVGAALILFSNLVFDLVIVVLDPRIQFD